MKTEISTLVSYVFLIGVPLLICAYSAQAWAKKCHDELKALRGKLKALREAEETRRG